jgi:hypothetical protein
MIRSQRGISPMTMIHCWYEQSALFTAGIVINNLRPAHGLKHHQNGAASATVFFQRRFLSALWNGAGDKGMSARLAQNRTTLQGRRMRMSLTFWGLDQLQNNISCNIGRNLSCRAKRADRPAAESNRAPCRALPATPGGLLWYRVCRFSGKAAASPGYRWSSIASAAW